MDDIEQKTGPENVGIGMCRTPARKRVLVSLEVENLFTVVLIVRRTALPLPSLCQACPSTATTYTALCLTMVQGPPVVTTWPMSSGINSQDGVECIVCHLQICRFDGGGWYRYDDTRVTKTDSRAVR